MTNPYPATIDYAGKTLRGSYYAPVGDRRASVLLNHGFGVTRMGVGRAFVVLARQLTRMGCAVYAFDRLGHGESDGSFTDVTVPDELAQLSAMLDTVIAQSGGPVHVVGHSLGGMESALMAAARPDDIASLTLWAAAAVFTDDIAKGEIQGKPLDDIYETGVFDFKGQALGLAFVEAAKTVDPYAELSALKAPVRVHQGAEDEVVDMKYAKRYAKVWGDQATLYTYAQADHGWNTLAERQLLIERTAADILSV